MGYPGLGLVQLEEGDYKEKGRGSGSFIPHAYIHRHTPSPADREQLHFYLVYILEFCIRFCLKRLCYCYVSVKITAIEASHLRTRGYFDFHRKEEFSDSLAYRIFF